MASAGAVARTVYATIKNIVRATTNSFVVFTRWDVEFTRPLHTTTATLATAPKTGAHAVYGL
jgi:hypothetical protein